MRLSLTNKPNKIARNSRALVSRTSRTSAVMLPDWAHTGPSPRESTAEPRPAEPTAENGCPVHDDDGWVVGWRRKEGEECVVPSASLANEYNERPSDEDALGCTIETGGCTDPEAANYDPLAVCDNGSCVLPVADCVNGDCLLPGVAH